MYQLECEREFDVAVSKLFSFWVTPELMYKWFAPGKMTVPLAEAEPMVGGKYCIAMKEEDGTVYTVRGEYREVEPDKKLVFTWQWDGAPNTSLVELKFTALSATRSKLVLKHSEFANQEERDEHLDGWEGCMDSLGKVAA